MSANSGVGALIRVDREASLPIATQLSQQLAWLIARGELSAESRLPPVRQLAEDLGISLHTVRAGYAQLEDDGFVTTQQGRGTTVLPRSSRRLTARGPDVPSFTFGIILPTYSPFFTQLLAGIDSVNQKAALPFVCHVNQDPQVVTDYLELLLTKGIDGIIVISTLLPDDLGLPEGAPPVVFADIPDAPGPSVEFDLAGIAYEATSHLLSHGHRSIGLIAPPRHWANVNPKIRGFERALGEAGVPQHGAGQALVDDFGVADGVEGASQLLELPDRPTAIYAASDTLAIGAMRELKRSGLAVPQDIAVVGSDNLELSTVIEPALTTVSAPAFDMGAVAMVMLRSLMTGGRLATPRVTLESALAIRSSCGCHPT